MADLLETVICFTGILIGAFHKVVASPHLNPYCTRAENLGPMADMKTALCASGSIPLPGVPDSREFREVLGV